MKLNKTISTSVFIVLGLVMSSFAGSSIKIASSAQVASGTYAVTTSVDPVSPIVNKALAINLNVKNTGTLNNGIVLVEIFSTKTGRSGFLQKPVYTSIYSNYNSVG